MSNPTPPTERHPVVRTIGWGMLAGVCAGLMMLVTMGVLRLLLGWPTPTELIFDRLFPLMTVEFFIDALARAGGYTPLKIQGVLGALAGHIMVAAAGGAVYALYLRRKGGRDQPTVVDRRGWALVVPSVLAATALVAALLWPTLITNYHGLPPPTARLLSVLQMLISFSVCGIGIMVFYGLLQRPRRGLTNEKRDAPPAANAGLRRFIALGVGAAAAVAVSALLRRFFAIGTFSYDGRQYSGPNVQKITPITPDDEFYQVSKNLIDPVVARDSWRLDIIGEVENSRVYTFAELAAMPAVEQETTLLCISYNVGSGLCSNALWKGVPLSALLAEAKPKPGVTTVLFHAADGYYETIRIEKALEQTTLLAYEMNGQTLPQRHGYPLRMVVPGLYGEKNPKWLTRIELLNEHDARLVRRRGCGFYKEQGWGREGDVIPTTSRFDAPLVSGEYFQAPFKAGQPAELRGIAFGGDRGIAQVEISTDWGGSWEPARISQPGTKISWSLWTHTWTPASEGETELIVRATDGAGKPQIEHYRYSVPDGGTGLHRVKARVEGV